jgi:16S rRNA G966 N2-methylase RsmD
MKARDGDCARIYERTFLLSQEKRDQIMELWEVQKYGVDSFSDSNYVCIYGMSPAEWYERGIRLLARTTIECVRDSLGELIGKDVAKVLQDASSATKFTVIDPFAGSCNSLYWILRLVRNSRGIAFEIDKSVFEATKKNLSSLDIDIELVNGDYSTLLRNYRFPVDCFIVVFVAPPWGDALNGTAGLDLRRTNPPVTEIVDYVDGVYNENPILWVTQVHQTVVATSLADLKKRFDWSAMRIYDINVEGMKHGVLLGTSRWVPLDRAERFS